tara:strand:- start:170 stop:763 length:594 start_codon:yes stop_codon:yes gene_type:complete
MLFRAVFVKIQQKEHLKLVYIVLFFNKIPVCDLTMIYIAIGSNLSYRNFRNPIDVCRAAILTLEKEGCCLLAQSRWYRSAPVPASPQPFFINGVVAIKTQRDPGSLMHHLHQIEFEFGRIRLQGNAARTLDLDLLSYHDLIKDGPETPLLPHPRMVNRSFVLLPLFEIAPNWLHPISGKCITDLLADLPLGQDCRPI